MAWIAQDYGTKTGTLEFPVATSVAEDNEGGVASGTSNISLAVRFKILSPGSSDRARVEQVFSGTNAQQWLMMGWVGTAANHRDYYFPQELRGWLENPVSTMRNPFLLLSSQILRSHRQVGMRGKLNKMDTLIFWSESSRLQRMAEPSR